MSPARLSRRLAPPQAVGLERTPAVLSGMAVVVGLRLAAILWGLRLPVFLVPDEQEKTT